MMVGNRLLITGFMAALVLFVGTSAYAGTAWDPASNGIYPPATGNWNVAANWTNGLPSADPCSVAAKAQFYKTNAAECIVTDAQTFCQLVHGDNGAADAGIIRIMSGGSLTTTGDWSGIGFNRQAKLIVTTGGVFNCGGHLWIGQNAGGVGTLELAGGTVNGTANFSLGWNGGTGYANIDDGVLNLSSWAGVNAIKGDSIMDIEAGTVIINGDQTGIVNDFVTAGKITAYDGEGTVVYDHGVTNPSQTTITAIEGVEGDIDGDNDVDIDDLFLFVQEWLSDLPIDGPVGAVAYWRLDETTGAVAEDDSPNGYDGTLMNMDDSDWVEGKIENALDFDGIDDYVEISGYKGITGTSSRTVCAWIKTDSGDEILSWGGDGTGEKWIFRVQSGGLIRLEVSGGAIGGSTIVNDGFWHHVAAVFLNDGTPDVSDVKLYVDGIEESTTSTSQAINTPGVYDVKIGVFGSSGRYFNGLIDDVRIYDRALSETEIAMFDSDCESGANFDEYCIIDFRDFAVLASNWMSGNVTYWHVADTVYPTDDIIVTPHYTENFGIVGDGVTDVTDALQTALTSVSNLGGGALFLPAGNYKVSGNLIIPASVTLRGDWQKPVIGSPIAGTILQAYAGRGDENATPFIELSGSSGVKGIAIWYPEQLPTDIQPYPPTIHGGGATVENVTFVNSYFGFTTYREGTTARPFMRNIYGTPLKTGIEYDCLADIGRMETVHFSPDYWADSGLPNAPTAGEHESWIYNNGTGVIVRRIDWSYSAYVTVEGYNIGFALRPSRYDGKAPNGQSYMFTLTDCETGIFIRENAYAGYQFTRFNIQGAQTGVYMRASYDEATMFHTCTINASGDAIYNEGMAKALMMSCDIQQGTLDFDGGYLSVINSNFTSTTTNHIELAGGVHGASILGNTFAGGARISDSTSYPVHIDHTPLAVDALPAYDYKKPTTVYKPAKSDLYVVTKSPYNAQGDGTTDDTAAIQAALADADTNGGGIVFVPGGTYRIDGNLTVPTGVELKGVFDVSHGTSDKGSLLNVYDGRNNAGGTPFIQIESGAGIRGLTFHYPEQIYDPCDTVNYGMVPYPFLIRGLGSDVYAINLAATIPYQLLDLATYRCDRHYVDYIYSTALKTGIHVSNGSEDGQIHNCQFNPSAYTHQGNYYDSIPTGTSGDIHKILWRDATPYLFGNMSGEVLHENFVFGGARGVHLVEDGGFGPSGYCMGMGVDQCTNALQIDDVGSGGLDMINSQIVTVNATAGHYLDTGASLTDTFRMFSSAGWGSHQYSAVINGGDVKLQLFHLARDGETGAFNVLNYASLQNLGGNLTDYLALGRPFLTIDSTATAEFIGNIINTPSSQMPTNTFNVTSIGNLRVQ